MGVARDSGRLSCPKRTRPGPTGTQGVSPSRNARRTIGRAFAQRPWVRLNGIEPRFLRRRNSGRPHPPLGPGRGLTSLDGLRARSFGRASVGQAPQGEGEDRDGRGKPDQDDRGLADQGEAMLPMIGGPGRDWPRHNGRGFSEYVPGRPGERRAAREQAKAKQADHETHGNLNMRKTDGRCGPSVPRPERYWPWPSE